MPQPTFHAAWWLPGPHAQTLWGRLIRRRISRPVRIERWETPDQDFVEIIRIDPAAGGGRSPRLLVLHGLEGTIRSHYVANFVDEVSRRGWGMDVLMFRSCGSEPNLARRFYHSGETEDVGFVLDRIAAEFSSTPIGLSGVSLGGNVLLKFLGERGDALPPNVVGAATVSVPYDLARGCLHIDRGFARVYQSFFMRSLKRKTLAKLARYPDLVNPGALARARTLRDFDDLVTAPVHGFRDAADYYARSSSLGFLDGIRRPTLLLSAADDPFLPPEVLAEVRERAGANPSLTLEFRPKGGHVGFVGGRLPWRPWYYAEWRVADWIERLARGDRSGAGATGASRPSPPRRP